MANEAVDGSTSKGQFGFDSREDEWAARQELAANGRFFYEPLKVLRYTDIADLDPTQKVEIVEIFKDSVLSVQLGLAGRLEHAIEDYNYKKLAYTVQRDVEISSSRVEQMEAVRLTANEGQNERVIGLVEEELRRMDAANRIFSWALPYKATYYGGFDSLGLLAERGEQLALATMDRMLNGSQSNWLYEEYDVSGIQSVEEQKQTIKKWDQAPEYVPFVENGETSSERFGRYFADADFWIRAVGEMNTYNPTIKGTDIALSQPMQAFLGDLLQRRPRRYETGETEKIALPTREITVYLNAKGEQVSMNKDGKPIDPTKVAETKKAYVEVLDFYNKARSEEEMRWVTSVISALSVNNAKETIDSLPWNFSTVGIYEQDLNYKKYDALVKKIMADATKMMDNYDILPKKMQNMKMARSAILLSDAVSFASFDIAERGFSNEWKLVPDGKGNFIWHVESSQGDPTASGDAFTAAKRYFHELVYQAIKNRISANNSGLLLAVDEKEAERLAQVYLNEAAEANDRSRVIELIKSGKQQHLAMYFGIMGAFKSELGNLSMWKKGEKERERLGKKVNPNLSKTIEETVVFVPTPYNVKGVGEKDVNKEVYEYLKQTGIIDGENILFPMVAAQYKIGLYDMLSAGKEYTVGDLLRRVWKVEYDAEGNRTLTESTFKDGGRRLTQKDIDWLMYARYADDSRAVNNNFMLQVYAPLYGPLNEKQVEATKKNPAASIMAAVKAADIALRNVIKNFANPTSESGKSAKRQSLEIMLSSSIVFHQIALGVNNLVGNGGVKRFVKFIEEITPAERLQQPDNLYLLLRSVEDFISNKQNYPDYDDSFYCMFLAQTEALKPIVIAANEMAWRTTQRFKEQDPTQIVDWNKIVASDTKKNL